MCVAVGLRIHDYSMMSPIRSSGQKRWAWGRGHGAGGMGREGQLLLLELFPTVSRRELMSGARPSLTRYSAVSEMMPFLLKSTGTTGQVCRLLPLHVRSRLTLEKARGKKQLSVPELFGKNSECAFPSWA